MRNVVTIANVLFLLFVSIALGIPPTTVATGNINIKEATYFDVKESIVKIYTQSISPYYFAPWNMKSAVSSTGSGCIISGSRVLTNAHVVSDQTLIQVRRHGEAKRYNARVLFVSHETDLALLTVDDPEFFEGVKPLEVGPLPKTQQEVTVYGFPKGGDTLSITKGVVSRIEHQTYAHSFIGFLAVQIDAAINPGNSGGPAIIDNQVVGIAMQSMGGSENIGYIVPTTVVNHFLEDVEDGNYNGFPSLGVLTQNIENPDHKLKYGMSANQTGALVTQILHRSPADGKLKPKDILLAVDGHQIADNGTVEFRPRERTNFVYYIQNHQIGETVKLDVLSQGKPVTIEVRLDRPVQQTHLVPIQYDILPSYYIIGGLVFSPLTLNYLKSWGSKWYKDAPKELLSILESNHKSSDEDQVVLLIKVLASSVNEGYHNFEDWVITKVNGQEIRTLKELIEIVEQTNDDSFVVFENNHGKEIVLNKK
ncbi:MAG TPA: serine protease, partial [Thermodesulfobacteriota bacterium]|nr:serine protease [Thermodesulfobacteriota bacterium]